MDVNVGSTDKLTRIAVGAVAGLLSIGVLVGSVSLPAVLSPVLGLVAVIMLVTGYTGLCPVYSLLGVDTCSATA